MRKRKRKGKVGERAEENGGRQADRKGTQDQT